MIGKNILDILNSLDMKKVLTKSFRSSLAKLKFLTEKTNDDVRYQIETILDCLEDSSFVEMVKVSIVSLLRLAQESGHQRTSLFVGSDFSDDSLLQLSGTFQGVLHAQILDIVSDNFAIVLSHMDRNSSLKGFCDMTQSSVWQYLFKTSFNPINALSALTRRPMSKVDKFSSKKKEIVVKVDGFENSDFQSRFPFSFYLCALIDSMRKNSEFSDEHQLRGQLDTVGFEQGLSSALSIDRIDAYLFDLVCMKCRPCSLSRVEQARFVMILLDMVSFPESSLSAEDSNSSFLRIDTLAVVHHRFWKIERVADLYFELLTGFPQCAATIQLYLNDQHLLRRPLVAAVHANILSIVLRFLEPEGELWDEFESKGVNLDSQKLFDTWLFQLNSTRAHVNSLADGLDRAFPPALGHVSTALLAPLRQERVA